MTAVGKNSPFTASLADNIVIPDTPIESVFKKVRVDVVDATNGFQNTLGYVFTDSRFSVCSDQNDRDRQRRCKADLGHGEKQSRSVTNFTLSACNA